MLSAADKPTVFIEPYSTDLHTYTIFERADKRTAFTKFDCTVMDHAAKKISNSNLTARPNADDGTLRTYRLAMSVTGEYTAYFGGTKALPLLPLTLP
jgi:hypothetical protein